MTSEVATLRLDFGQLTWDFSIARTDLSPWIKAGESWVPVTLTVNSKYRFTHHLESEARSSWGVKIDEVPGNPNSRWLGGYRGSYDPSNGAGEAVVSGRVPKGRTTFGDLSFSVNGHQVDAPLITHPDYASALEYGRSLVYQREGLYLAVDFGAKSWIARVDGKAFHERLLPQGGSVKLATGWACRTSI